MEILIIALGVFAGLLLLKARWVVFIAIATPIYLHPAHGEEIDEKYWPIMAAAQVFHAETFKVGGLSPHITASSPFSASIIDAADKNAVEYTVTVGPDSPCYFNLKRGPEKIAEINFDKLTDQISTSYFEGDMIHVFVEARQGALCKKVESGVGCTNGRLVFLIHESRLEELQRALRYIFQNVCAPAKIGPVGTQR
jgi:hypothetical protein